MKPYYAGPDGLVTLYLGDFRDVLPSLSIAPDVVITDPPYGETTLAWDRWVPGWPSITAHATGDNDDQVLAEVQLVLDGATITDLTDLRRLRS